MSKKKIPNDEELSDVKVEVPRKKNHRREAEPSDVVRHKHRRDAELSDVTVKSVRHKQRRDADPSDVETNVTKHKQRRDAEPGDVKTNVTKHKQRRDTELGDVVTHKQRREAEPSDVRVAGAKHKQRRNTHTAVDAIPYDEGNRSIAKISSRSNDYVYDNKAYVGSLNNVNEARSDRFLEPPTSVYREQYWACSKWSFAKKVLAIAVGVALGAGIGLAIILVVTGKDAQEVIDGIFQASSPD